VTTIYVTHDQVEAMTMGDRVAVIRKGGLQQVGTPGELFAHPVNLFVAGFIGSPAMNFVESTLERIGDSYRVMIGGQLVDGSPTLAEQRPALKNFVGKKVIVGIRLQDFEDAKLAPEVKGSGLKAKIDLVEALGTGTLVHFTVDAPAVLTEDMKELAADVGADQVDKLEEHAKEGRNEFVAQVDPKALIVSGEEVDLVLDSTQLHFFDPDTSEGIY
jgi:multiple sugar transport system ATP-binding protein